MKRIWLWALIVVALCATGLLPLEGTDVAKLKIARVLILSREDGRVQADCGEGLSGSGDTVSAALAEMERTADGVLFPGTVDYVAAQSEGLLAQALDCAQLRPATKICVYQGELPDAETVYTFLNAHKGEATLGGLRAAHAGAGDEPLPLLRAEDGRMMLFEG